MQLGHLTAPFLATPVIKRVMSGDVKRHHPGLLEESIKLDGKSTDISMEVTVKKRLAPEESVFDSEGWLKHVIGEVLNQPESSLS